MINPLLDLDDPRSLDPSVVGSKAAGLARLRAAGFDVPDAIVIPVEQCDGWPTGPAPGPVRDAIGKVCAELGPRLAVRSSATWEDGDTSAHAGATTTVLDVEGAEAVLGAIRQCLEGTALAQSSRGQAGSTAVILQRLIAADHAGVAFTVDPVTGERDVVRIAATKGLGEALVQGEVIGSDVTVRGHSIDGDLAELDRDTAIEVADLARRVEESFARPQDIEWAVADGRVHLLQARPITVVPVEPSLPEGNNWQKDVAHYPEPLTPFGWSLIQAGQEEVRSVFDEMGLLVRGLEEIFVGGEIYGRVLPAFGSADAAGNPPPALVLGVAARVVPALRKRTAAARRAIESGLPQLWEAEWHRTDRDAMVERAATLGSVDLTRLDDDGLVDHLDRCMALAEVGIRIHFRLVMPLFQALYRLHSLVAAELGWDDATIATMFAGHSPATRAADEALAVLRERIRATSQAVGALEADPADPIAALRDVDAELGADVAAWVDLHGWAIVNYDAGVPVLAERPTVITRLLLNDHRSASFGGATDAAERARAAIPVSRRSEFDDALAKARAIYPVREDNTIVVGDRPLALLRRWMLEAAKRLAAEGAIPARADAAYLSVEELRSAVADGRTEGLPEAIARRKGEEAWVRAHPGPLFVGEQGAPPDISHLPPPLRTVNEPVLWGIGHEYPPPTELPDDAAVLLAGVAASAGVAEGPARVIRGHDEMDQLQPGEVLVCQVTSPAWAPLFPLAAAIVADGGGALSHAAIAARKHGLPAVLGTSNGTSTLRDGQRVRVDGTRGVVMACD